MSSDQVHTLDGLTDRVRAVGDSTARLEALRDRVQDDLTAKEQEVERLTKRLVAFAKVGELFRALMDKLVNDQVRAVEDVVTEGLRTIFHDLDLSFEATVGPKRNAISVDFYIRQGDKEDPLSIRGRPLDAFGGGPTSVSSLILRVLTLLRLKRRPILALDESLGAVSEEYTDHTGRFLQRMAESMKIDILLVTHKPAYLDHANVSYRCAEISEGTSRRLILRNVAS